ncbi:MAG: hypothetical protein ACKN9V_08970 [Pseudomonadota bacterium]
MTKSLLFSLVCFFFSHTVIALELPQILESYPALHKALAEDKIKNAQTIAQQLKIESLAQSKSDEEARKAFGVFSEGVVEALRAKKEFQAQWQLFYCPMVPKGTYGYWIQPKGETILNPYYGAKMLTCGVKRPW